MPSLTVSAATPVFTPMGWSECDRAPSELECLGIDGRGRPAYRIVRFHESSPTQPVYLACDATFGILSSETQVICGEGSKRRCLDIVMRGDIGALRFETFLGGWPEEAVTGVGDLIWTSLSPLFEAPDGNVALARTRIDKTLATALQGSWGGGEFRSFESGTGRFVRFTREDLDCVDLDKLLDAAITIGFHAFADADGTVIQFPARCTTFGLWWLSGLRAKETSFAVRADSLQYTLMWTVQLDVEAAGPFSRGVSASTRPRTTASLEMRWEGTAWSPVVAGFIGSGA